MKKFPRIKSGDRLTPRHLNVAYIELERLSKMHGDGSVVVDADRVDGPLVKLGNLAGAFPVITPGGGIPARSGAAPGVGTCTACTWDGQTFGTTGTTLPIRNGYTAAVGGNKFCWCVPWQGAHWVATEQC